MKQVTLHVPDREYEFFIQLLKKFDFIKINDVDFMIPEEDKQLVRERRKTAKKNDLVKWNDVKKTLGI